MKYIITDDNSIAIFSETCTHSAMARGMSGIPVSAGFMRIEDNLVHCFGNSISLDLGSRREIDDTIINKRLFNKNE